MSIKEFIDKNYIILTNDFTKDKIENICSYARVVPLDTTMNKIYDSWRINKFLIDNYFIDHPVIKELETHPEYEIVFSRFSTPDLNLLKIECGKKIEEPLLVIKLNDMNSVPELLYEGKRIDNLRNVCLDWETKSEEIGHSGFKFTQIDKDVDVPYEITIEKRRLF